MGTTARPPRWRATHTKSAYADSQPSSAPAGSILDPPLGAMADAANHVIYRVTDDERDQRLTACLDGRIEAGIARALGLGSDDLFVCMDRALDDQTAANLALGCRLRTV